MNLILGGTYLGAATSIVYRRSLSFERYLCSTSVKDVVSVSSLSLRKGLSFERETTWTRSLSEERNVGMSGFALSGKPNT